MNGLTLSSQFQSVVSLPELSARATRSVSEFVSFSETATLLSGRSKSTKFAMFVYGLGDPLSVRVATDGLVCWVDQDYFEELVGRILADPIRVENSQATATTTDAFLKKFLAFSVRKP